MTVYELAELKIKEACKRENPDWDGESFDYERNDCEALRR